jgi:hypothetical protein
METSAGGNGCTGGSGCDSLRGHSRPIARTGTGETADLYRTSTRLPARRMQCDHNTTVWRMRLDFPTFQDVVDNELLAKTDSSFNYAAPFDDNHAHVGY